MSLVSIALDAAQTAIRVPAAACIATNDALSKPMGPSLTWFTGGIWGVTPQVAILIAVIIGLAIVVTALTDAGRTFMKKIGIIPISMIATILVVIIIVNIPAALNNAGC